MGSAALCQKQGLGSLVELISASPHPFDLGTGLRSTTLPWAPESRNQPDQNDQANKETRNGPSTYLQSRKTVTRVRS